MVDHTPDSTITRRSFLRRTGFSLAHVRTARQTPEGDRTGSAHCDHLLAVVVQGRPREFAAASQATVSRRPCFDG